MTLRSADSDGFNAAQIFPFFFHTHIPLQFFSLFFFWYTLALPQTLSSKWNWEMSTLSVFCWKFYCNCLKGGCVWVSVWCGGRFFCISHLWLFALKKKYLYFNELPLLVIRAPFYILILFWKRFQINEHFLESFWLLSANDFRLLHTSTFSLYLRWHIFWSVGN